MPKTIDNDLPLPENAPTFGFETARAVGTNIIEIADGRRAHHRALVPGGHDGPQIRLARAQDVQIRRRDAGGDSRGIFRRRFDLRLVVDTIVGAIIKRRASGHDHGVAIVAEGIAERADTEALEHFGRRTRDAYGHVRLADLPLGTVLRDRGARDRSQSSAST